MHTCALPSDISAARPACCRRQGAALRTSLAGVVTDLVRDDAAGEPSYLLHCERSSGRYLVESILAAGAEFGAELVGDAPP